jgi:hypothetical protein
MTQFHATIVSIPLGLAFFLASGYLTEHPLGPARHQILQQYQSAMNAHSTSQLERTPWMYFGPPSIVQGGGMKHS